MKEYGSYKVRATGARREPSSKCEHGDPFLGGQHRYEEEEMKSQISSAPRGSATTGNSGNPKGR